MSPSGKAWVCKTLIHRFDSDHGLTIEYMPGWRNGIREGLKILCQQWLAGSSPASGTEVVFSPFRN